MPTRKKIPETGSSGLASLDPALLSAIAHASSLAFFLMGPLTVIIPLIIWLSERNRPERSELVEFHARQAFFFQSFIYLVGIAAGIVVFILTFIFVGLLLIPFLILFMLGAIGYGVYGGLQVWQGREFRYKYVTDFIERTVKKT
jgi:uncharacterized Tic20 family protein